MLYTEMEQVLRDMKWSEVVIDGVVVAVMCPLCSALVASGTGTKADGSPGLTGREHHTRWHLIGVH